MCAWAGIGRSITRIDQIDLLQRPLSMEDGGVVLMDLLWSDPTTNDGVEGVQPSPRGPGLVTFGPDRVKEFCKVRGCALLCRPVCAREGVPILSWHGKVICLTPRPVECFRLLDICCIRVFGIQLGFV